MGAASFEPEKPFEAGVLGLLTAEIFCATVPLLAAVGRVFDWRSFLGCSAVAAFELFPSSSTSTSGHLSRKTLSSLCMRS